jgi:hypothetical protein
VKIRAALLAGLLALGAASQADAKRASFDVSIAGSQTTRATSAASCLDASGSRATQSGTLTERADFRSSRSGRMTFATAGRRGIVLKSAGRLVAAGTVTRSSTLDERGITPGACASVVAASECGSHPFGDWRLTLGGSAGALRLASGKVTGGNPFRTCQNPFDGFPGLVRHAAASISRKAAFSKKRTIRIPGNLDVTRKFEDGYTNAHGNATTSLRYIATLSRR